MVEKKEIKVPDIKGSSLDILIEADMYDLKEVGKTPAFEVQLGTGSFSSFVTRDSYLSCGEGEIEKWQNDRNGAKISSNAISTKKDGNKVLFSLSLPVRKIGPGDTFKVRGMRTAVYRNKSDFSMAEGYYPTEEVQIKLFLFREKNPLVSPAPYDRAVSEVNKTGVGTNKVLVNLSGDNSTILDYVIDGIIYVQDGQVKI